MTSFSASVGTATLSTKGNSAKEVLVWDGFGLAGGASATLSMEVNTDLNPAGGQEYTECGAGYEYNSGAVLKYRTLKTNGKGTEQNSAETGSILIDVFTLDLLGDCDGDGIIDLDEIANGTDPFDATDP